MKKYNKISKIFFSPSGTTEKIVNEVAKNFNADNENYDLMSFNESKEFEDELVIIGIPVFDGRIPKIVSDRLKKIKGNETRAIVILNYGNINYGYALLELTEKLNQNNFNIIGIATTASQHSLFNEVGKNRPDEYDLSKINKFSRAVIEKLNSNKENQLFISGIKPYPDYTKLNYTINCDSDACIQCLDCAYTCPEEAIPESDPTQTYLDECSSCISIRPENARSFVGECFDNARREAIDNAGIRKEAEFYM